MNKSANLQMDALKQLLQRLWQLAAATVLIAAAAFCGWQTWLIAGKSGEVDRVRSAQKQAVDQLSILLRAGRDKVQAMTDDSGVRDDLKSGDAAGREAAAKRAAVLLPEAEQIAFFSASLDEVVHANYDKFGYSRAAQLLAAQSDGTQPLMQASFTKQHAVLTLARQVGSTDAPLGYVWVELPFAPVRDMLGRIDPGMGRLELRLGDGGDGLLLTRHGRTSARIPDGDAGMQIPGTRLRVIAALPEAWIVLPDSLMFSGALTLLCLAAAAGLLWIRHRSMKLYAMPKQREPVLSDVVENENAAETATAASRQAKKDAVAASPAATRAVNRSIFRAYDIRGVVGTDIDADVARLIGLAIGSVMQDKGLKEIVVGRDGRLSGPELSEALAQGLREAGIDVIDIGAVPTPLVYFAAYHFNTGSGVAVTGSHNPPDYNGFKIVVGGETLSEGAIQDLYERIAENRLQSGGSGELRRMDVVGEYIDRIADDVQAERPLKVVVDAGNGIAGAIGPQVLQAIGCQVVPLYCEVDGEFPNHHPDPSDPHNLEDLILSVKSTGADLGVAFDGDGDRLGVVTREGEIIYPDRLLMLFARDVLVRNPGATIIYDVKCTGHLQSDILNAGGSPMMWRTGHSLIKAKMRETEALLAGEMSGHFFFRERWFGFDDGIYAAARLLEVIAGDLEERSAEEIFATLPKGVSTPELKIHMQEGEHYAFIKKFSEKAEFEGARLTTIDGVRADWKDGWGLVRASNTTPVLVLRFDADDEAALQRIQQTFREQLLAVDPELKLPF
ncbi:phosphomannomutase/phosphoglucomutase [Oleiagrimonas soli]|uniref:phosphomannomutase n=1 Tax=Oleiagrimonas soli TaxID=1543381 RepID=A0A099D1M7_9GAMM|nr:phosphomannomutase/phosphoglucomutase [Oleiagrimonas soli]KGI79220.1 phosphoglucomutase [Oleiagrimonas soli]MBB6184893.1 phosphomannomutase/phosphoglucomutase [Oleiagrimonas soli]